MKKKDQQQNQIQGNIKVCIRVRPLLLPYEDEEAWNVSSNYIQSIINPQQIINQNLNQYKELSIKERKRILEAGQSQVQFNFEDSNIENQQQRTSDIYKNNCKKIVLEALKGYHGSIMCYGQTTSGKTFTMLGNPQNPGLLPCALRDIFQTLQNNQKQQILEDFPENSLFDIHVQYLEIYNESINDLLNPGSQNLKIQEDQQWGVNVAGLKKQRVQNFDQAIMLMNFGENNRIYGETSIHEHSSRSHTIYRIFITSQSQTPEGKIIQRESCLNMVDLAGSERLNTNETGQVQGETGYINKSLFALTNVINKLSENKQQHIPYRDSKLTRLIQLALGGNSLTSIICCISPAVCNYAQTISTLQFAQRAQKVAIKAKKNEISNIDSSSKEVQQLQKEIQELTLKYQQTQDQLEQLQEENYQLQTKNQELQESLQYEHQNNQQQDFSQTSFHNQIKQQEQYINLLEKQIDELKQQQKKQQNNSSSNNLNSLQFNSESNLLDIMIDYYIQPILQQEKPNTLHKLTDILQHQKFLYKNSLTELQNQSKEYLANILAENVPQDTLQKCQEIFQKIDQNNFLLSNNQTISDLNSSQNIDCDFLLLSQIQNEQVFLEFRSEYMNFIQNYSNYNQDYEYSNLYNQFDTFTQNLDKFYDESRIQLQLIFRKKIAYFKNQEKLNSYSKSTDSLKITQDHETYLTNLRNQYNIELKNLQKQFSSIIHSSSSSKQSLYNTQHSVLSENINSLNSQQLQQENRSTNSQKLSNKQQQQQQKSLHQQSIQSQYHSKNNHKLHQQYRTYTWGSGKDGRLGINGTENNYNAPTELEQEENFTNIQCGYHSTMALNDQGQVYTWGRNNKGQLGNQDPQLQNIAYPSPVQYFIDNKVYITQISCGWQHSLALSSDGTAFSWGGGDDGQLGTGDFQSYNSPQLVKFQDSPIVKIAAGHSHSGFLTENNEFYTFGCNTDLRLMNKYRKSQSYPQKSELSQLYPLYTIIDIALGVSHTLVLTQQGTIFAAGCGTYGQLGVNLSENSDNTIVQDMVHTGEDNSTINQSQGMINNTIVSNQMSQQFYCYLTKIPFFGKNNLPQQIAAGDCFSLVLTQNNQLYSFGKGSYCRLGLPNINKNDIVQEPRLIPVKLKNTDKISQIQAGIKHGGFITSQGKCYVWGFNFYEQLGLGQDDQDVNKPTQIFSVSKIQQLSLGHFHSAAVSL